MPRQTADLLAASANYVNSNLPLAIRQKFPLIERIRKGGGARKLDVSGTNIKYRMGPASDANPWVLKGPGFAAQSVVGTYYNTVPMYANYVLAKLEVPWAIDTDQQKLFDEGNMDKKGAIIETISKSLIQHYITKVSTLIGGSGGATNQTASSVGSLNWLLDATQSVGGINPASGHAAKNEATYVLSLQNLRRSKRFMEETRGATPTVFGVSTATGGNDLEGKMANWANQTTVTPHDASTPNIGFPEYTVLNLPVFTLSTLPANEMVMLQEDEMAAMIQDTPDRTPQYIIPGTAVNAQTMWAYIAFLPLSMRNQWRATGCS